ncbi:hypothetical protein ACFZDJ_47640 [Streptomyces sp. NPDC007896]|uniref:hypothetical protein n=1 Tax=Streptomyces sp. NPDC007896 TaxID=3364784 RepID=UPI0036E35294
MNRTLTRTAVDWPEPLPVPESMRAVVFRRFGPPDVPEQAVLDTPRPGPGEVLVQAPR